MKKIKDLIHAIEKGRKEFDIYMAGDHYREFRQDEIYGKETGDIFNHIGSGDNLDFMKYLIKGRDMAGKIQLIYLDPPFFSNSKYQASVSLKSENLGKSPVIKTGAYDDRWSGDMERYLRMLVVRLLMMKELLSDTGSIWVHLDWHGSHYVKMIMDEIFGEDHFVNEIIWTYKSGGASKKSFAKKHDTILFYSKGKKYKFNPIKEKSYNRGLKPYRFKGVEEFQDEVGWYTLVNMKDVWSIDMVGRTSGERTGYATQKPEKLIERIISACTDEGDICADFFSGSGTLGAVASRMGRPWIMCDEGNVATASQIMRLADSKEFAEGQLSFDVMRCEAPSENGSVDFALDMGCIRIDDYKPNLFGLNEADEAVAAKYVSDDGTSAVSFWSVDAGYDGLVHKASGIVKGKDFSALMCEEPHIVGYDVFGNRFHWEKNR